MFRSFIFTGDVGREQHVGSVDRLSSSSSIGISTIFRRFSARCRRHFRWIFPLGDRNRFQTTQRTEGERDAGLAQRAGPLAKETRGKRKGHEKNDQRTER